MEDQDDDDLDIYINNQDNIIEDELITYLKEKRIRYVDTSPHKTLGHVTPFRVHSRLPPPSFLHQLYYITTNPTHRILLQQNR
jgi:hypothetical protein